MKVPIGKLFRFTGLAAAVLAWIVILLSISYNPWFVFTKHAFSDLGSPTAEKPWIFNYGLIIIGVLALLYSLTLIEDAANKIENAGGAFTFIAGIFLALIGTYPSGTRPHTFVSTWFFIQSDLAIIAWGMGLLLSGLKVFGMVLTAIGILAPIAATIIEWPSIAIMEACGITLIDAWAVLMLKVHMRRARE